MEIPPYEESKDVIQRKLDQTTMILQISMLIFY